MPLEQLRVKATSLFDQGNLVEADRLCSLLLGRSPDDEGALNLKEKILIRYLERDSRDMISSSSGPVPNPTERLTDSPTVVPPTEKAEAEKVDTDKVDTAS